MNSKSPCNHVVLRALELARGDLVAAGAVSGGRAAIYGPGVIEFGAASSAATTFALGSTGELILDVFARGQRLVSGKPRVLATLRALAVL